MAYRLQQKSQCDLQSSLNVSEFQFVELSTCQRDWGFPYLDTNTKHTSQHWIASMLVVWQEMMDGYDLACPRGFRDCSRTFKVGMIPS